MTINIEINNDKIWDIEKKQIFDNTIQYIGYDKPNGYGNKIIITINEE